MINNSFSNQSELINEIKQLSCFITNDLLIEQFYLLTDKLCMLIQNLHPQILCKNKCNLCCKEGFDLKIYKSEWNLIKDYLSELSNEMKLQISLNLKTNTSQCPLLINEKCSIYPFRPFNCRIHGYFFKELKVVNNEPVKCEISTCSKEKLRWNKYIDFNNEKWMYIPIKNKFEEVLISINNNDNNKKSLSVHLKDFFDNKN